MRPLVPIELLEAVVTYFAPQRVILFGSAARGDMGLDSDIDLLVIVDDDTPPEKVTLAAGYESRRRYRRAADVFPIRPGDVRSKATRNRVARGDGRYGWRRGV